MNTIAKIDQSWTLFLDRDGVINKRNFEGYILKWQDFEFTDGLLNAAGQIGQLFGNVFVITNQQCVGKGLISKNELDDLHSRMCFSLAAHGLTIQDVKVATEMKGSAPFRRKPHINMALEIQLEFPHIDFSKTIMVGDTDTDILFGKELGMHTVLVRSREITNEIPDLTIEYLADLPKFIS
jgi:D-glycero-D-manno-heptose 1,7-bisphosphate phosphatase